LEVPLLFESGFDRYADVTIVVKTAQHRQIARALQRMNITRAQALRRIRAQMPFKDKIRLADFIIDNNHSKTNTLRQVKKLWQELLKEEKRVTEGEK
jgi:dephospho-CoA kinase